MFILKLYNTLHKTIEEFTPLNPPRVGMYTCGMTVYDYAHIGHGKKYVGDDILRRTLIRFGYTVTHVQNVTDVGHLVSDADEGEDKLEKGALKAGKNVWEIAEFFTRDFYDAMDKLNVLRPDIICRATQHIPEQIALVEKLLAKNCAYETPEAIYFDVTKFPSYGKLGGQALEDKQTAVREGVEFGEYKKHPADFALWFKCVGRFKNHVMRWQSPWGEGFPGWHIECSAMSMKYLGDTLDIHTGGIDHISLHHQNEIAQSESATGKPFVRYWIHHAFLTVDGEKMSKSVGNTYRIDDVIAKGFDPLALRYFYLGAHYRTSLNFTWDALRGAQQGLSGLRTKMAEYAAQPKERFVATNETDKFISQFNDALGNDLNTPQALAVVWDMVKSSLSPASKYALLVDFDTTLGLKLSEADARTYALADLPKDIQLLIADRENARKQKGFAKADALREQIEQRGFVIEDTPQGIRIQKKVK